MMVSNHERARYYMHVGREHLDGEELATLEKHLDACAECRAYAVELASLQNHLTHAMRARWSVQHPGATLEREIRVRLARHGRLDRILSTVGSLAAAGTLLAATAALVWLLQATGPLFPAPALTASPSRTNTAPAPSPRAPASATVEESRAVRATRIEVGATHRQLNVAFADYATLTGFDVGRVRVSPGEALTTTLFWRISPVESWSPFNVVMHLVDAQGKTVAYSSSIASHGPHSAAGQRLGEMIAVLHHLALPDTLPPGTYRLVAESYLTDIGLYPGAAEGTASVLLATIQVE